MAAPARFAAHPLPPDRPAPRPIDWLWHELVISGPAAPVAALQAAAVGSGSIPWRYSDLDLDEEDRTFTLMYPPDGSPGLDLEGARALARLLRDGIEVHQQHVLAAATCSQACPFDLQALLPVPPALLRRGPDDPASVAWLTAHWGVVRPLRRVELAAGVADRRLRRSARLSYTFWSADWTPWQAIVALRQRWPLVFDIRPDYGTDG